MPQLLSRWFSLREYSFELTFAQPATIFLCYSVKAKKKKKKRIESRIGTKAFCFLVQKLYSIKRCFCEAEFGKELNDLKIPYVQTNNINFERCKESQGISYNRNSLILSEFIRLDKKLGLLHNSPVLIKDFLALLGLLNYCYQWNFVLHRIHSE